jgi:hypothetical protein
MSKLLTRSIFNFKSLNFQPLSSIRNSSNLIKVDVDDKTGFATVSLNKMPVNSLDAEFMREISKTFKDLEVNRTRGAILTSVRTFSKIQELKTSQKILIRLKF